MDGEWRNLLIAGRNTCTVSSQNTGVLTGRLEAVLPSSTFYMDLEYYFVNAVPHKIREDCNKPSL